MACAGRWFYRPTIKSTEQRVFLKTLANMAGAGPFQSNEIEKLATATYGIRFNEKGLPKQVLYPLEKAGFVDRGGKGSHRNYKHPKGQRVTVSGGLGDDVFPYQERQVRRSIEESKQ